MHEGHRARMLERLAQNETLQDHELLEVVLYNAIPRKNTNEIAHALLSAFGSLRGVFAATPAALAEIPGVGKSTAAYLCAVSALFARVEETQTSLPRIVNAEGFSAFLTERYRGLKEEVIELFCLDSHDAVTFCKRYTAHAVDIASVPVAELSRLIVSRRPSAVVLAHNHPAAPAVPSYEDDSFTAKLQMLCSMNNVVLGDHFIVGTDGTYSYFLSGRLEEIRMAYNVTNLVHRKLL